MGFYTSNNPCPCESGLQHLFCCGSANRGALNVIARIDAEGGHAGLVLTPQMREALDNVAHTPDLFPVSINFFDGSARLVKMSPFWYEQSIFLDAARILGTCAIDTNLDWLESATQELRWQHAPVIFHTAFCGSTLLSKALTTVYDSLPLREPEVLGNLMFYTRSSNLTQEQERHCFERVMGLLSRRFDAEQVAVIKANDHSTALMSPLLQQEADLRTLFMYVPLSEFLVGCLKENSRRSWIRERFYFVRADAIKMFGLADDFGISDDDHGSMAALYWSYNIMLYLNARESYPQQVRCLDFNDMLQYPVETVEACGEWFKLRKYSGINTEGELRILFGTYSKGGRAYSTDERQQEIDAVLSENEQALDTAEQLARELLAVNYPDTQLPGSLVDIVAL